MATSPVSGRQSAGGAVLNLGVATLAAAALGFLVFAMPNDIFTSLVAQSGLPNFVDAAQPPLGMKARGAAIAASVLLVFTAVLLLLRGIDRLAARPAGAPAARPAEAEAPRLRRADSHPDAPSRRPLLAGRDLGDFGDPDEGDYPPDEMFADLPAQPLPGFLAADREAPEAPAGEIEPPAFEEEEPEVAFGEEAAEPEEQPEAEAEPLLLDTPLEGTSVEALVSQLPEAGDSGEDIAGLMHRLESGLVRREAEVEPPAEEAAPEAEAEPVAERSAAPAWLAPQPEQAAYEEETNEPAPPEAAPEPEAEFAADRTEAPAWLAPQPEEAAFEEVAEEPAPVEQEESGLRWPAKGEAKPASLQDLPPVDEFGELTQPLHRTVQQVRAPFPAAQPAEAAAPAPAAETPAAEPPPPVETQVGHRLRSALGEMNKLAGRG